MLLIPQVFHSVSIVRRYLADKNANGHMVVSKYNLIHLASHFEHNGVIIVVISDGLVMRIFYFGVPV